MLLHGLCATQGHVAENSEEIKESMMCRHSEETKCRLSSLSSDDREEMAMLRDQVTGALREAAEREAEMAEPEVTRRKRGVPQRSRRQGGCDHGYKVYCSTSVSISTCVLQ